MNNGFINNYLYRDIIILILNFRKIIIEFDIKIKVKSKMAKKFKDYYDVECARLYVDKLLTVCPSFDGVEFVAYIEARLAGKALLERQDLFVDAFERTLSAGYADIIALFHQILGPELPTAAGMYNIGWWLWPAARYVERHGCSDFESSMAFLKELTKRFTGEFAIRPLIVRYPKEALKVILAWSTDENVHVRRLACEGLRIRLPWAKRMDVALREFELYKQLLSGLRHDPERFVQKSVGNSLNDLYKECPYKARGIINEWQEDGPSKATLWIINHGLRSERKKRRELVDQAGST